MEYIDIAGKADCTTEEIAGPCKVPGVAQWPDSVWQTVFSWRKTR